VRRSHEHNACPHVFLGTQQNFHNLIISQTQFKFKQFYNKNHSVGLLIVYPLKSSKIVSKLSGVSTKSQRMHK